MARELKVLVVENAIKYDISDDLKKQQDFMLKTQGISVSFDRIQTDLALAWKDFFIKPIRGDFAGWPDVSYWGLDGIKEQLRNKNLVPNGRYHAVVFLYENPKDWDWQKKGLGAWTYPNPLNWSIFIESPCQQNWEQQDEVFRILSHELLHAEHRILWNQGIVTRDTMDLYDKELQVFATDGNRARNIKELAPWLDRICITPPTSKIQSIYRAILEVLGLGKLLPPPAEQGPLPPPIPPPQPPPLAEKPAGKIFPWALAIMTYEGWFAPGENPKYPLGSLSYRNNNPGNFRLTKFMQDYFGAQQGIGGFASFKTQPDGLKALCNFLIMACKNQLIGYHDATLISFFQRYCEDDPSTQVSEPIAYANFVAKQLKVAPQTKIQELL